MVTEDKNKDGFFRELFAKESVEKAPDGFTDRVMDTLMAEAGLAKEGRWSWSGWWLWGSILFAVACLVVMVFFIDFTFMGSIFEGIELDGSRMNQLQSVLCF